jgi:glycosyltransferase involved in cell wall biosynthesis
LTEIPDAQLLIVGKGRMEAELLKLSLDLGISGNVHFLGLRTDVLEIMQSCNAFLLPSHVEGLPGVILEAMYAQCPVVAYDVGGIGEVVINGDTGMLLDKDQEEAFSQAVIEVVKNKEKASWISANAHTMVVQDFSNQNIAKRFLEDYSKLSEIKA